MGSTNNLRAVGLFSPAAGRTGGRAAPAACNSSRLEVETHGTDFYEFNPQVEAVPIDLNKYHLQSFLIKPYFLRDPEKFEAWVLQQAEKFGYASGDLERLDPQEAAELVSRIVEENFEYDRSSPFAYGAADWAGADELPGIGVGVCRNYSKFYCAVFEIVKKISPGLVNIYATPIMSGNFPLGHELVQLTAFRLAEGKLKIEFSAIDPTRDDYDKVLLRNLNGYAADLPHTLLAGAGILLEMGKYDKAIQTVKEVARTNWQQAALVSLCKRYIKNIRKIQNLRKNPADLSTRLSRAELFDEMLIFRLVFKEYSEILHNLKSPAEIKNIRLERIECYRSMQDYIHYFEEYLKYLKDYPEDVEAFDYLLISMYARRGAEDKIIPLLEEKLKRYPAQEYKLREDLAFSYMIAEKYPEALSEYQILLAKYPERKQEILINTAHVYRCMSKWEVAVEILREAIALDPGSEKSLRGLEDIFRINCDNKDYAQAVNLIREIGEKFPTEEIRPNLIKCYLMLGRRDKALGQAQQMIKQNPEALSAVIEVYYAAVWNSNKLVEKEMLDDLYKILDGYPDNLKIKEIFYEEMINLVSNPDQRVLMYAELKKINPARVDAYWFAAALEKAGRFEGALLEYKEALKNDSDNLVERLEILNKIFNLYQLLGRQAEAIKTFNEITGLLEEIIR